MVRRAAVASLAIFAACAGTGRRQAGSVAGLTGGALPAFVRQVNPFPVADSTGRTMELAFLGGFNVPRPQLLDVDGDDDLDLFVQEHGNDVMLFLREGDADGLPRFVLRTMKYGDLDVGEWYRFADVDLDGDLDLLSELPFSYIRYHRNDGARGAPRYVLAADTLRDVGGTPIFAERQNIAQLGDLDCNGRSDLLLGRLDGTVTRYEAADTVPNDVPRFKLVAQEFEGIRIVGGQMGGPAMPRSPGPTMHGANTMALADHDEDGDLDLFWGDFFEAGLLLIENAGSCAKPNFQRPPVQFPVSNPVLTSGYNAPAFGEVSSSGHGLELIIGVLGGAFNPTRTAADNLFYLDRDSSGAWTIRTRHLLPVVDVGSESFPALVDLDDDGDLDLLLANKIDPFAQTTSRIYRFENTGSVTAPSYAMRGTLPISGRFHLAPAFGDLDGDGRADMIAGQWGAALSWYRNTASGFSLADSALVAISRGSNTIPALGDLDGDGDLDLLVGESSGYLNYFRNDGDRAAPRFALVSDSLDGIRPGRRSAPALADLDGDGDLDLLVGVEAGDVALYWNDGTAAAPRFVRDSSVVLRVPGHATPAVADLDGDEVLDLLAGCRRVPSPELEPVELPFAIDTLRVSEPRDGVVHRFVYSSDGPWAIHVLEARADRCWSLAALKSSGGAIGRAVTSDLVRSADEREEMAGGVNADFFLFTPPGVPVGLLVGDGRVIAGPIAQPALAADSAGRVHIARFETVGHVIVAGRRMALDAWNRDAPMGLALFDPSRGLATDTASGVLEIVLSGAPAYRVAMLDTSTEGVRIPAGGAVLKVGRNAPEEVRASFRSLAPGAAVTATVSLAPFHPREAVGGRPVLVREGEIATRLDTVGRSGFATSRHPRTAAGISLDRKKIFLVTVDGRQAPYSDGMTLEELAALMHALGAHDAVNLDGGGSTAMVVASGDSSFRVVNKPSDRGGERAVGDAVGLVRRCP